MEGSIASPPAAYRFGPTVGWRTIEIVGAAAGLFLMSGAVATVFLSDADGALDPAARSKLQFLGLPVYVFSVVVLVRRWDQFVLAFQRNLPLALVAAVPFLSAFWSISPSVSVRRAIGLALLILFAATLAVRFTPKQLLLLVGGVLGGCMLLSLVALAADPGLARMPGQGELRGVFVHKNVLGWYAAIAVLTSSCIALDRSLRLRSVGVILLVASLACLLLSRSATALVAAMSTGFLVGFYLLLSRLYGQSRVLLLLLAIQFGVLAMVLNDQVLAPLLEQTGKDASLTGRVPLWALVDEMIARRPVLGYGYQAFWTDGNGLAWYIWERLGWPAPNAHNGLRDVLLSVGIVGVIPLLAVIAQALARGATLQIRAERDGWLWLNVFVGMFLIMAPTETMILVHNSFMFLLFVTAVIMFSYRRPA